jgi:hypothetical protein
MTVVDITKRSRFAQDYDIRRTLIRACTELGGEEGLRGYFKKLAQEHPDLFVKLLLAALAK